MIERGKRYTTQLSGKTVTVRAVEVEQSIDSRHRGKWVCVNEATGRRLHRTSRQLHGLSTPRLRPGREP